jgi:RimJ/RimL family protein N-acetyltransferase
MALIADERVALGPLDRTLLSEYQAWMNDPDVRRGRGWRDVFTAEATIDWYEAAARGAPERVAFTVYDLADGAPVGVTELRGITPAYGIAGFAIALGARRGQGLGTAATRLTLRWAFEVLGLHNVMLEVRAWNTAAITAYERAGFRPIGVRRGATFTDGQRGDELLMDAVSDVGARGALG